MPTFPSNPLEKLALDPDKIDQIIDLGDVSAEHALAQVEQLLQDCEPGYCICLRFTPAKGDGSETLFQPLGRYLLQARREGRLEHCLPTSDGSGYVVTVGSPER